MDIIVMRGPSVLHGEVTIAKSKNAYLPILAGVLLTDKEICFNSIPQLKDIQTMNRLLENLGVTIKRDGEKKFL